MTTTLAQSREELSAIMSRVNGLTADQVMMLTPFLSDIIEAVGADKFSEVCRDDFRKCLNLARLLPEPTITVLIGIVLPSSDVSWEERKCAGGYDRVSSDITEACFPLTLSAGPRDLVLAHFGINAKSEDVEAWAQEHGYEVAFIDDLFAVGSHSEYKKFQREFSILALGSSVVVDGNLDVPNLSRDSAERNLCVYSYDDDWSIICRFLLCKVP